MDDTMLAVSIILPVPTWHSLARQCAGAVLNDMAAHPNAELLLVAPPGAMSAIAMAGLGERVRLVQTSAPYQFAAAGNDGADAARGGMLVFLAHDLEPQAGWLDALLTAEGTHPEAAVIGSVLLRLNDTVENAGFFIGPEGAPIPRYRGFPAEHAAINRPTRLRAVAGAGMLVRRDAFRAVAGFDTAYRAALHDVDLCVRLGKLGQETRLCPESRLYHYAAQEPADTAITGDTQLFRDRWRHQLPRDDVQHYLDDDLLSFTYGVSYPARIDVSPLLAMPDQEAWEDKVTALLDERARQTADLLRDYTREVLARTDDTLQGSQPPIETLAKAKLRSFLASGQRLTFPPVAHPRVSIVIPLFNQAHFTYLTLENLRGVPVSVPFEVILVNDASTDATARLLQHLDGVQVRTPETNRGFGETCNDGLAVARGEYVCFLNSDIVVTPGWLDALAETMETQPACGAVGAKLVFPSGVLQEAGSILWGDGSASGYGRGGDPDTPEYSYARVVDFCSAACLLVRKALIDEIGGFDTRYSPAYYEDVDLCLRIAHAGAQVWYAPHAAVLHLEHASSGRQRAVELQLRNRENLKTVWPHLARDHGEPLTNFLRWRDRRYGKRILVVDDLVPLMQIGSGFPRTAALLEALTVAGYVVTYLPATDPTAHEPMTRRLQSHGIEVLHSRPDVGEQIAARQDYYDLAIVSRPHNAPLIPKIRAANRDITIVYDAEALFSLREANQARAEGAAIPAGELARRIRTELAYIGAADLVLTVSDLERRAIEHYHPQIPVAVWGHAITARSRVPDFAERTAIGFMGYLASPPNNDALLFLIEQIMPRLCTHGEMPLLVAGSPASPAVQAAAARQPECVTLLGFMDDLTPFYDRCRVFVAPHRFAAGIPLKVVEAMANGVPCVLSPLLAEQLAVTHEAEVLIAADPEEFAAQITRLFRDAALWQRMQRRAFRMVRERFDPAVMRELLRDQIERLDASVAEAANRV